jgi:hypothetical protein
MYPHRWQYTSTYTTSLRWVEYYTSIFQVHLLQTGAGVVGGESWTAKNLIRKMKYFWVLIAKGTFVVKKEIVTERFSTVNRVATKKLIVKRIGTKRFALKRVTMERFMKRVAMERFMKRVATERFTIEDRSEDWPCSNHLN